jgi:hypothetical protein
MNNSNLKNKSVYQEAKKKVKELKSLYFSLIFYLIINTALVYIWYEYSDTNFQWFWFPLIGWGIGLVMKALYVYDVNVLFGKQWEERKMNKYLDNSITDEPSGIINEDARLRAKKKVDSIKGFYSHFTVYLLVNTFIVTTIVWNTGIEIFSFSALAIPLFWGIGLVSHALGVFGEDVFFGKNWEERKINELMSSDN